MARSALALAIQLLHCALSAAQTDPGVEQIGPLEAKDSALARCGQLVAELRAERALLRS